MASSLSDFRYQCAPCVAGRVRVSVLGRGLADMTSTAKALQVVECVGSAAAVQRADMVNLVPVGTARLTPPAVAVERAPADRRPASPIQRVVVERNRSTEIEELRSLLPEPIGNPACNEDSR